jgi:hypothetical protein
MTELVVKPEIGLGPFELGKMQCSAIGILTVAGSSVRHVVQYIRANNRTFNKAVTKFNEQVAVWLLSLSTGSLGHEYLH